MSEVPINEAFRNLERGQAFTKLSEFVEDFIRSEERLFWNMDEKEAEVKRTEIKAYKVIWNKILTKISNSKKER